jgi:hypothetical protein
MRSCIKTVILGDLIHSREKTDRAALATHIAQVLTAVDRKFSAEFHAPLILAKGIDEISGVLNSPATCFRICRTVNESMHPHCFRFAVVQEKLDVAVDSRDSRLMDGPAFHMASDLMAQAKKQGSFYSFRLGFLVPELEGLVCGAANLTHVLRQEWTRHQRRVIAAYEQYRKQERVARKLGISQQAVSDALREAKWKSLVQQETLLDAVLQQKGLYK